MEELSFDTVTAYRVGDAGATRKIIAFHAAATGPHALVPFAKYLAEKANAQVILPAFVGYGSKGDPSVGANLDVARRIFQDVGDEETILFGHSMGGYFAALLAQDLNAQGQGYKALHLYEPILHDILDERDADVLAWDREIMEYVGAQIDNGTPGTGVARFIEAWNETAWENLPEPARAAILARAEGLYKEATELVGRGVSARGFAEFDGANTYTMVGQNAPLFCHRVFARLQEALPNLSAHFVDNAGHMAPVQNPRLIASLLVSTLD